MNFILFTNGPTHQRTAVRDYTLHVLRSPTRSLTFIINKKYGYRRVRSFFPRREERVRLELNPRLLPLKVYVYVYSTLLDSVTRLTISLW